MRSKSPRHAQREGREQLAQWLNPRHIVLSVVALIGGLILSFVVFYGSSAFAMVRDANRMLDAGEDLANSALGCGGGDVAKSATELVSASRSLRDEMSSAKWTWLAERTGYESDLAAAREMTDSIGTLVDGPFTDLLNLAKQLQGFLMKDGTVDVSPLMKMPDIVKQAHTDIADQLTQLKAIDTPRISKIAQLLQIEQDALATADSTLGEYDQLVNLMPQLLGADGERTYLVLVQNPAELRSSGGMVGTVAPITADNGKVTIGDFATSGDWDIPDEPMDDLVLKERDVFGTTFDQYPATTTIDPEFERVAKLNVYLWKHQKGNEKKNVAGVIALDPVFLQSLLGATGSVSLSDGTTLDGTSTVSFLLDKLYREHSDFAEQNKYVSEAAQEIMTHVLGNVGPSSASALLKAIRDTSANGHLKLWMKDDAEQEALIDTGLIDDKASGQLSADETIPQSGIYLSELQMGKQDWYLRTTTTVTKTCGDELAADKAAATGSLNDAITQPVQGTQLGQYTEDQLGDEYTVTFTMKNTLTAKQAAELPDFVTGGQQSDEDPRGGMKYRVVITAPYGGEITTVQADADTWRINAASLYDRQYVVYDQQWIAPGETLTLSYTVRVSAKAAQALDVVTTPIVNADGIEIGSNGKVTDECPAEKRGGAATSDTTSDGSSDGTDGSGTTANGSGAADGTSGKSDTADKNSGSSDSSSSSGKGSSSSTGKSPGGGLDSLSQLTGQIECPVSRKQFSFF
ncbi:hypothetical protein DSM100688_1200 [Bifidobacterium ramosum]|uniref:DUF4012 domain-containing protein n=1 Tax=Bifidobacterium ramosum TaxID=1798158 RepID=A0A6L4X1L0_9BIFI|nr:DUF4012 domain-containing protein [Bifidobacterium ramosum]KAB8288090.1 hypothetical protein DSM100688_1200 [Bifidobacterium ramosum]NEG72690.1 DUF4012 domain-containing protein [Bifidobacterium ramosum]